MHTGRYRASVAAVIGTVAWCLVPGLRAAVSAARLAFDPVAATVGNARLLALGVVEYVQDYDERLPPTQTVPAFQAAVLPYVRDPSVFVSPETQRPFVPNAAISGQSVTALGDPETVRIFQDTPSRGTPPVVAFLDQHIERNGVVEQGDPNQLVYSRAHSVALGVIQYVQDYDERLPPMQDAAAFQAAVFPYVRSQRDFYSPNGAAFVPNASLSGVALASIPSPASTVLFQDTAPYIGGQPTVAYVSGRVVHGALGSEPGPDIDNVKQLALGVAEYAQDNGRLPPTDSNAAFQSAILPYVRDPSLFVTPDAGLPYRLNPAVSGLPYDSLVDPATTEVLRDPQLNSDGTLNIGYADGHASRQGYFLPRTIIAGPDGNTHLLWNSAQNGEALWTLTPSGGTLTQTRGFLEGAVAISVGFGGDGRARLLWDRGGGAITLQTLDGDGTPADAQRYGPYDGWTPLFLASGPDGESRILWRHYDGTLALWRVSADGSRYLGDVRVPAGPDSAAVGLACGADGRNRLLWKAADGTARLWTFSAMGLVERTASFRPHTGFGIVGLGIGQDSRPRLLWDNGAGRAEVWTLTPNAQTQSQVAFSLGVGGSARAVTAGLGGDPRVLSAFPGGVGRLQTVLPDGTTTNVHDLLPFP